jgi:hypothetical protein
MSKSPSNNDFSTVLVFKYSILAIKKPQQKKVYPRYTINLTLVLECKLNPINKPVKLNLTGSVWKFEPKRSSAAFKGTGRAGQGRAGKGRVRFLAS